ncbi:hypothetical protein HK099_006584 [Clydaea vesicula]|uniref:ER-bound oxygenase mpaB/mpaB'/Rubber oxygenase catalytic domain-containing protein n=1 Tax=Clydaea vesicula TaxID=447962 RepID=A0AAD5U651_9FUNG|nr:hypothetical protein HK099_006584 [Clydaea vesicula]
MFQQSFPCNEQFQSPYYEPVIQFSKYHKTEMELEKLRLIGDEICEKAVTFIETIKNSDISNSNCPLKFRNTLNLMRAHIENESNPNLDVVDFLSGVSTIPEWVDFSQIERGQFSLIKYSFPTLCLSLLHSSLVGGVSSPKINAVLISTGYLSGSLTFQRLIETTHWLIDIMKPGSLVPGRKGWRSTISVRILHEKVRQTIKRKISRKDSAFDSDFPVSKRKKSNYDIQKYGVPINQEDMIATALSFFGIYFDTFPRRLGIVLQERELLDILAVWR